jgi:hypothetical protein
MFKIVLHVIWPDNTTSNDGDMNIDDRFTLRLDDALQFASQCMFCGSRDELDILDDALHIRLCFMEEREWFEFFENPTLTLEALNHWGWKQELSKNTGTYHLFGEYAFEIELWHDNVFNPELASIVKAMHVKARVTQIYTEEQLQLMHDIDPIGVVFYGSLDALGIIVMWVEAHDSMH